MWSWSKLYDKIDDRIREIKKNHVDKNKYFVINNGR